MVVVIFVLITARPVARFVRTPPAIRRAEARVFGVTTSRGDDAREAGARPARAPDDLVSDACRGERPPASRRPATTSPTSCCAAERAGRGAASEPDPRRRRRRRRPAGRAHPGPPGERRHRRRAHRPRRRRGALEDEAWRARRAVCPLAPRHPGRARYVERLTEAPPARALQRSPPRRPAVDAVVPDAPRPMAAASPASRAALTARRAAPSVVGRLAARRRSATSSVFPIHGARAGARSCHPPRVGGGAAWRRRRRRPADVDAAASPGRFAGGGNRGRPACGGAAALDEPLTTKTNATRPAATARG